MQNIIIYGTGRGYQKRKAIIDTSLYNVFEFWDSNPKTEFVDGIRVTTPHRDIDVDKIIITSNLYYSEIYDRLTKEMGFPESIVERYSYFEKQILLEKYKDSDDEEIKEILQYLKGNDLDLFNYEWLKEYPVENIEVYYDPDCRMYYHPYEGKRMYIKRNMDDLFMVEKNMSDELKAKTYVRTLLIEQDKRSPHYYWEYDNFDNKVVIDGGAAEGNFSLHIIDRCKKVILVETDTEWIEALNKTFAEYGDKVVIVPKFVGNTDDTDNITLKSIFEQYDISEDENVVIKLDIEGAEEMVLESSKEILKTRDNIDILACTYHHSKGYENIRQILENYGYKISVSEGYLFFTIAADEATVQYKEQRNEVDLRKGLVYAGK